jgi:hypothetical protein
VFRRIGDLLPNIKLYLASSKIRISFSLWMKVLQVVLEAQEKKSLFKIEDFKKGHFREVRYNVCHRVSHVVVVFCCKEILPKTSINSCLMSLFKLPKTLKQRIDLEI